jgi:hypothetical protein
MASDLPLSRPEEGHMKKIVSLSSVLLLGFAVSAFAAETSGQDSDVRPDRREVRQDRKEIRQDTREIRQDVRERRADVREGDKEAVKGDTKELRADRRERQRDVRELRRDRRDLRQDRLVTAESSFHRQGRGVPAPVHRRIAATSAQSSTMLSTGRAD